MSRCPPRATGTSWTSIRRGKRSTMPRSSEDPARAGHKGLLMPTPLQGGFAVAAVIALAVAVGAFDGDGMGGGAADAPAAPDRTALGVATPLAANGAGARSDTQALDPTTSAPMANPFSTF